MWGGAGASLCPHVHKEVLPKRNPKNQEKQRTKNEHEKTGTFWTVSSVDGTFWAVSRVGGTLLAVFFGGSGKIKIWRYFSAVMQYGGTVLAVGGFRFSAVTTLAVGGITKIWR